MHTRTKKAGFTAGAIALLLLIGLFVHAAAVDTVTPTLVVLALADAMLWMLGLRLFGDASAYVHGVRETVDRLASALKDR